MHNLGNVIKFEILKQLKALSGSCLYLSTLWLSLVVSPISTKLASNGRNCYAN